jgi:ribosomal-protein-alanine N-acetyltransferase
MKAIAQTSRLIFREINEHDENDLYEMDSDPEVHRYITQSPVRSIKQVREAIKMLQQQYKEHGIARWAVVDKTTNECLGWAGLKYFTGTINGHANFYEHGYRFKRKHWGKGLATEASNAILDYAFSDLHIDTIYALTDIENVKSKHVLRKLNFEYKGQFNLDSTLADWFELKIENWKNLNL